MGELLNIVGLGTGVVLYAMLLVMVLRAPHRSPAGASHDWLPLTTAVLGLAWNLCALPLYTLPATGILRPLPYLAFVGFSALGFLPAVAVHSALRAGLTGRHRLARATLTMAAYAASGVAVLVHAAALVSNRPVPAVAAMRLLTYIFVLMVLPVALVTRQQPGARRALSAAALAAFAVSALHLTQLHTGSDSWFVELAGHHASLPLALAILYQEYRFAFADLFLKRALTILALVAAAFVALATLEPHASIGSSGLAIESRDVSLLVTLWVLTALAYPWLHSSVGWFVDRVILARPDYRAIRRTVTQRLSRHDEVEPLLDEMSGVIASALGGSSARWFPLASPAGADGTLVSAADGCATIIVPTGDTPQYSVESPLTAGQRLLSDDVATLEVIAVGTARRIDAIRLTRERWDRELREQEMSKLAAEAELRALRAQINPHFLFNALTTIGYLIQTAPPRALDTMMRLTALLRAVLKSEGEMTTLGQELDLVQAYLDIERARFEDRLDVRIAVPHALRAARLPPLLLQPLVENAIKHGVSPQRNGARIVVTAMVCRARDDGDELCVAVRDTGAGASEHVLRYGREHGVGLRSVERRLAAQYGDAASLTVDSAPGLGMLVEIRLPVALAGEAGGVAG